MAAEMMAPPEIPSADLREVQTLLFVLSLVAGTTDVIGFLGLNGLFTAHITGNLVILCARIVGTGDAQLAPILSIPVFAVVVALTRLLAGRLEIKGVRSLRPLLLLQFLLLVAFLGLCEVAGRTLNPNAAVFVVAGMVGVSAMAVQNAIVQSSLREAPSTAIMTSNVTRFALDVGTMMLRASADDFARARKRAGRTLPVIIGFGLGCAVGAILEGAIGLRSLALPAALALICVLLGFAIERK